MLDAEPPAANNSRDNRNTEVPLAARDPEPIV